MRQVLMGVHHASHIYLKRKKHPGNWDSTNNLLNPFSESECRGTQENYQIQSI